MQISYFLKKSFIDFLLYRRSLCWHITCMIFRQDINERRIIVGITQHRDIVVIGGGIIGAAIAYFGSKSGLDITILEKGELASGTSSRCDGNILAIDKDPGFDSQMSLESQKLVHELSKELEIPF